MLAMTLHHESQSITKSLTTFASMWPDSLTSSRTLPSSRRSKNTPSFTWNISHPSRQKPKHAFESVSNPNQQHQNPQQRQFDQPVKNHPGGELAEPVHCITLA